MSEFLFVLKVLALTAVITLAMQVRIGGNTIEERTSHFLTKSQGAVWIQSAAAGGALALQNLARSVKSGIERSSDSFAQGAREQRAGR